MKQKEGRAMASDIGARLDAIEQQIRSIQQASPNAAAKLRQKLKEKILEVLEPSSELDDRLAREVAFFAEKVDISEEIARLHSHFEQFRDVLKKEQGPAGRKLEFLVQEIGREINTIGSKASDAGIARLVIEAKSELEKIREQIQNIE